MVAATHLTAMQISFGTAFDKLRRSGPLSTHQTFDLLTPDIHLTNPSWKDFREKVHSYLGWTANRRLATQVLIR
jgi:hypothetical protein